MATAPLRQILETHFAQLSTEVESLVAESRDRGRREFADQLNQAVRRIRHAADLEELAATLVDASSAFASGAALFGIAGEHAEGERIRGVDDDAADRFRSTDIPLASAAALAGAVETRDPVTAVTSASEVSADLIALIGHGPDERVSIFPIVVRDQASALLYAWGEVQVAVLELLSQVAAAVWTAMQPPPAPIPEPAPELVQIAPAAAPPPPAAAARTWDGLPPEEQQIHLKAQRFARVNVAEMRLYQSQAVQAGRTRRDLYGALRDPIDAARDKFRESFGKCPSMVDYLHVEIVRTLANDDPELLGKDYPGPMVA